MWQKIKENAPTIAEFAKADPKQIPLRVVDGFAVPEWWSDNAAMICRTRYANEQLGETSAVDVCVRIAGGWGCVAVRDGYIGIEHLRGFGWMYANIMLYQLAAPNSPQWFNTGVHLAGGRADSSGNWVWRPDGSWQPDDALEYPQVHACFINSVKDQLVGDGSIDDLWTRETRIFKHGSGSGANFSDVREAGAPLSGGGTSSGVMSFLNVGDSNAGAIKSGGTTRRAALMRVLDIDHPDIEEFINWKSREEAKVAYLAEGSKIVSALANGESVEGVDPAIVNRINRMREEGILDGYFGEMDTGWTSEAYLTVGGQNSNNSVRVSDAFMCALIEDSDWTLKSRVKGGEDRTVKARDLWDQIAVAAWLSADPAVQFSGTINAQNTAANDGEIVASNPCSEYLYLNDTACNLASINLAAAYRWSKGKEAYTSYGMIVSELAYVMTIALDISINMASYPSEKIAKMTYNHRTLGLGFTGLGECLAINGIAYGSTDGQGLAETIARDIWHAAYWASVDMAEEIGPCDAWYDNKDCVSEVYGRKLNDDVEPVRNMQLTCIAPTGTISFAMDAGSTGIEPVFALKTWKTLAEGGGMWVIALFIAEAFEAVHGRKPTDEEVDKILNGDIDDKLKAIIPTANDVSWQDHVAMMAAVQKYVCGAISKTVNMPESASVQDVKDVYMTAWESGVKCIAVYRDQSKLSQPLNVSDDSNNEHDSGDGAEIDSSGDDVSGGWDGRRELPSKRKGYTQKVSIDSQSMYIRTGEFNDGTLGELFLDMGKEGGAYGGLLSAFAKAVSIGLQYGVPLYVLEESFIGTRTQPAGFVFGHDSIKMCTSPIDLIFKDLRLNYGGGSDGDPFGAYFGRNSVDSEMKFGKASEPCPECGGFNMVSTGTCSTCQDCGSTTGCA